MSPCDCVCVQTQYVTDFLFVLCSVTQCELCGLQLSEGHKDTQKMAFISRWLKDGVHAIFANDVIVPDGRSLLS